MLQNWVPEVAGVNSVREYLFVGLLLLAGFIVIKWNLRDAKTHRWNVSDDKNRIGFALLSLVFIAGSIVLLWH
ncbi:hypothetical protein ASD52_01960 [Ensifer sp. Root142]|jgi:hypothetical protein|nr:hypothetical protein ASD52_01960 [Ensifer sp. Root142]